MKKEHKLGHPTHGQSYALTIIRFRKGELAYGSKNDMFAEGKQYFLAYKKTFNLIYDSFFLVHLRA